MNDKAKAICHAHIGTVCATGCPLRKACDFRPNDTKEAHSQRLNDAAEEWSDRQYPQ
jgi:hypothetical protein